MRKALAVPCLALALAGCHHGEKKPQPQPVAVAASGAGVNVTFEREPVLKKGVLIVQLRVANERTTFLSVVRDRCEVETTDGRRRRVYFGANGTTRIAPRDAGTVKLVFGEVNVPLFGESFRIYLWAEPTDGSGIIASLPVVTVGAGAFANPPKPFSKDSATVETLPPPTDAPPPMPPPSTAPPAPQPTPAEPTRTDIATSCPNCGEPRSGNGNCPHCGLP